MFFKTKQYIVMHFSLFIFTIVSVSISYSQNSIPTTIQKNAKKQYVIEIPEVKHLCGKAKFALPYISEKIPVNRSVVIKLYGCLKINKDTFLKTIRRPGIQSCSGSSNQERHNAFYQGHVHALWSDIKNKQSCVEYTRNKVTYSPPADYEERKFEPRYWGQLRNLELSGSEAYTVHIFNEPILIDIEKKIDTKTYPASFIVKKTSRLPRISRSDNEEENLSGEQNAINDKTIDNIKKKNIRKSDYSENTPLDNKMPDILEKCSLKDLSNDIKKIAYKEGLLPYVAQLKSNSQKLTVFEWDSTLNLFLKIKGEHINNSLDIERKFARIETRGQKKAKYEGLEEVESARHFVIVPDLKLGKVASFEEKVSPPVYTLRIVSSASELSHLKLLALDKVYKKNKNAVMLKIFWKEIHPDGSLSETDRHFKNFEELARNYNNDIRVNFSSEDKVAGFFYNLNKQITHIDFDHMIILKGSWMAPLKAAEHLSTLITKVKQASRKESKPKFIDIYSDTTTAYGNDYLKIAIKRNAIGHFYDKKAYEGDTVGIELFPTTNHFWKKIVETAQNIQIIENRKRKKSIEPKLLVVDANEFSKSTGYILVEPKFGNLIEKLVSIKKEISGEKKEIESIIRSDFSLNKILMEKKIMLLPENSADLYLKPKIFDLDNTKRKKITKKLNNLIQGLIKQMDEGASCIYINDNIFK